MAWEIKDYPVAGANKWESSCLAGLRRIPVMLWFLEMHCIIPAGATYIVQYS